MANSSLQARPFVVKRCLLISVNEVLNRVEAVEGVGGSGGVRTRRDSKEFSFLEVNDGSCLGSLQVIADAGIKGYEDVQMMATGSAIKVQGNLVASP
ncbi:MAG: hypothetical protein MK312_05825, partial [Roseibacillus sp.]|nr:hypothetical protein [Roseibacillus sp.]